MNAATESIKERPSNDALLPLLERARRTSDYGEFMGLCRKRKRLKTGLPPELKSKSLRLAVLGSATTDFFEKPLQLELETHGIELSLHTAAYNSYAAEILNPDSETVAFKPDVAVLLTTPYSLGAWPRTGDSDSTVTDMVERYCDEWLQLCATLHASTHAEIVINNLHMLPTRPTGNLGCRLPWDPNNFLRRINQRLAEQAPQYVHILDIDMLATLHGLSNWFDARFWHHSKQPVSFNCLVPFVRNLAAIIAGLYGRSCKCIAVDLDNTLWGGVVGDDGLEGIRIGEGDAVSESFKAFQSYLLSLKERGVLLAVCSKNEEANALAPFSELPDMVLRREDFVAFKANWEPKPDNIRAIADELNIGLDAILFVDDNPAEREHVRQVLPAVKVLELGDEPADYAQTLDLCGWLEVVKLTGEDREKTKQYRENAQRTAAASTHSDYDSYLRSLEQKAVISPFESRHLERITQLINKTNQFNLTTQRLNRSQVEALLNNPDGFTVQVRLADRFGDNGLISVLAGHRDADTLHLDIWLMSCRVFKRGVEFLLANHLFEKAAGMGIDKIQGTYIPSAKNGIVEHHYRDLGFRQLAVADDGSTTWSIDISQYEPAKVYIDLAETE